MPTKRLILLAWFVWAAVAYAAAPTPVQTFCTTAPDQCRKGTVALLAAKGTTDNIEYMAEIDTTTGEIPVKLSGSTTVSLAEDHNYGVVGATTLRTAAQIGNATGAASFSTGASSAQTLRVVTATDSTVSAQNFPTTVSTNFGAPGASTLRAAAELGVGGAAVSNANPVPISDAGGSITVDGTVAATQSGAWSTDRTWTLSAGSDAVVARLNDGSGTSITSTGGKLDVAAAQNGTWTVQPGNTANTTPWLATINQGGNSATVSAGGALKVDGSAATQPVSGTVTANQGGAPWTVTGTGTAGTAATGVLSVQGIASMTPIQIADNGGSLTVDGTVSASNFPATVDTNSGAAGASTIRTVLATRHESVATPLAAQLSNGSAAINYDLGAPGAATVRTAAMMGVGSTAVSAGNPVPTAEQGHTYSDSARNDYSSVNVTTGAWVQLIASTAAAITRLYIDDTCGQVLELGTGAAAAETRKLLIPRGGFSSSVDLAIPAGTRVSLRAITSNCTTGDIVLTGVL